MSLRIGVPAAVRGRGRGGEGRAEGGAGREKSEPSENIFSALLSFLPELWILDLEKQQPSCNQEATGIGMKTFEEGGAKRYLEASYLI